MMSNRVIYNPKSVIQGGCIMLKITKVVGQSTANMSGCGKLSDNMCGIRAKMG